MARRARATESDAPPERLACRVDEARPGDAAPSPFSAMNSTPTTPRINELSDVYFPDAKQIVLVQDNLNTHMAASLYAAFPAEEARASPSVSSGITHPNTEAGSTWPNPNSRS